MECAQLCQTWACTVYALGTQFLWGAGMIVAFCVLFVAVLIVGAGKTDDKTDDKPETPTQT